MAKTFRCSIVTPAASLFDDEVTYASFPAWDGQHGMMAGQAPLLTKLGVGSLRVDLPSGESKRFFIDGGFAQVQVDSRTAGGGGSAGASGGGASAGGGGSSLTLLTEGAGAAESIKLSEAEAELAEANARIPNMGKDQAKIERQQARALAKVALARGARGAS